MSLLTGPFQRGVHCLFLGMLVAGGTVQSAEQPFPETGILRAFSRLEDTCLIASPWPRPGEFPRIAVAAEERLEVVRTPDGRKMAPLPISPSDERDVCLYTENGDQYKGFKFIRARPGCAVTIPSESFDLIKPDLPEWKATKIDGAKMWQDGVEIAAKALISDSGFYDVAVAVMGMRVYEAVPRIALAVDQATIGEFDVPVPRRKFRAKVHTVTYLSAGKHVFSVRCLKLWQDWDEHRNAKDVYILGLEASPRSAVVLDEAFPMETALTARVKNKPIPDPRLQNAIKELGMRRTEQALFVLDEPGFDVAKELGMRRTEQALFVLDEPGFYAAKELGMRRTEQGLFVLDEPGFDVAGEYRPAIFAPPGTVFEWKARVPSEGRLRVGMGIDLSRLDSPPAPIEFRVDVIPQEASHVSRAEETVLQQVVNPWENAADRQWCDKDVDLSRWAGMDVTLRFSTKNPSASSPQQDFCYSFWSEPHLYVRPKERKPNVVIHLIDTLRKDHVGCYGYKKNTTPYIDSLAKRGTLFENAVTQAPYTTSSIASIFTALYPETHRVFGDNRLPSKAGTLAQELSKNGYLTFAVVDNLVLPPDKGYGRGFDRYFSLWDTYGSDLPGETPEKCIIETIVKCLEAADGHPFFLYVQSIYPHLHYWGPKEFRDEFCQEEYKGPMNGIVRSWGPFNVDTDADLQHLRNLYDSEIRCADQLTKDMLDAVDARTGDAERLFVLTADHGEEMLDHGWWGHGHALFGELLKVPLIFLGPTVPSAKRVVQTARTIDIAPTVLDILGVPEMNCQGESLMPYVRGERLDGERLIFSQRNSQYVAVQRGCYKYLENKEIGKHKKEMLPLASEGKFLFDIAEDPLELNNLLETKPEIAGQLKAEITKYRKDYAHWLRKSSSRKLIGRVRRSTPENRKLTPDEIDDLRALGYLK